jgi:F-type H+-transporting ATPase subunit a
MAPGRLQSAVEMGVEYVYGYVEQTLGSERLARRYFPFIMTVFVFVLTANLLEFLPIYAPLGFGGGAERTALLHVPSADLNTTLALAIISFFVAEFSGILTLGALKYGSKFVNFRGGAIGFIIGLLEIIGNLARLVSLSFRLFGTIFAGETLLLVIAFFVPYVAPVPLMAFELFIGFLQAAIFAILSLAYIKLAVDEPHSAGPEHAHGGHASAQ